MRWASIRPAWNPSPEKSVDGDRRHEGDGRTSPSATISHSNGASMDIDPEHRDNFNDDELCAWRV